MFKNLAIYLSFLVALIAIDLIWLLGIAKNLYRNEMGDLMAYRAETCLQGSLFTFSMRLERVFS
ncbi:DUF2177 family protein [Polynucleobacter necessarius]|uniref:DUF2177 family protein n=1 Tax=Polynucleobacter necessarius TaxID=576610 RepID=UPI001E57ACD0|nr:DUF2177 family protein [Polynucleobacter necessarius]